MTKISFELVATIRGYINEPYIGNRFRLLEPEKWLQITAALDTLEDAAMAIDYYSNDAVVDEVGKLYLHIYGLLQALYVSQDCAVSLSKAILGKGINFREESSELYFVREVRDDVLHATDRGKTNKSYIYLAQYSLSKPRFDYFKQSAGDSEFNKSSVDVMELIEKNNKEINRFLDEIVFAFENELKMKKEKYAKEKLSDIFRNLNYAAEKITEQSYMAQGGYEATKTMFKNYKDALNERFVSWEECIYDAGEIKQIEKIYEVLDGMYLDRSQMPSEKIEGIKEVLLNALICHLGNLEQSAREYDAYCVGSEEDEGTYRDITVQINYADEKSE